MRSIDADALIRDLQKVKELGLWEGMEHPENRCYLGWWKQGIRDAMAVVEGQPTVTPEEEPARLLTEADFDKSNSSVDVNGFLPCWVDEYGAANGHWGLVSKGAVDDPSVRFWTKQPTKQQMEETPWG